MKVAVVGAGPAGAAAAVTFARAGADVALFERARWPRPKTCGDGVTPDGIAALATLGVALPPDAPRCPDATVVAPRGARAVGRWNGVATVIPRIALDAAIIDAAVAAGAALHDGCAVTALDPDGTLATANLRARFDAVVLAEGATGGLATALGLGTLEERQVAVRGYADAARDLQPTYNVVYDRGLTPGYGWIFPTATRRANVGICVPERAARGAGGPRALLDAWLASDATVRELLGDRPLLDDVRGGVIPTGRARRSAGRVFAAGDAAGVADPLSAEGISQAIATGVAAARALIDAGGDVARARAGYAPSLRDHDRNAREARRLRALFRWTLDPMIALAARRPAVADHLVSAGFSLKTDGHWFHGVRGALLR